MTFDGLAEEVEAAILAGGTSRRFGSDKCLARFAGDDQTFLDRVIAACSLVAARVVIIGPDRQGQMLPVAAVIADIGVDQGPLVGLLTALRRASAPYLLVTACDQPLLTGNVLARLLHHRSTGDVVVFTRPAGGFDPLPCVLRRETALPVIEEKVAEGARSLIQSLTRSSLRIVAVPADDGVRRALRDIDTPEVMGRLAGSLPSGGPGTD